MKKFDATLYMKAAKRTPILTRDEELKLCKLVLAGDVRAQQKLISSNLRFVIKIAHSYKTYCRSNYRITFDDIVQAGNEGLIMATKKFDPERGFKFITYAVFWVKAYIHNLVRDNFSITKIGTTRAGRALFARQRKVNAIADLDVEFRDEARENLAKEANVNVSDVRNMEERLASREVYLHEPIHSKYDDTCQLTYGDVTGKESDLDERIYDGQVRNIVHHALNSIEISERERCILHQRFFDGSTLNEIGIKQGVSRERIRQIEAIALKKFGSALEDMGVAKHDILCS